MPKAILWPLAILFPIGFSLLMRRALPDSPTARFIVDVTFLLASQPAFRLAGFTEATYWKVFAATTVMLAGLLAVPETRFDHLITLSILATVAFLGFMKLIRRLRTRPGSV